MRKSLKALNKIKPIYFDVSLRDGLQTVRELLPLEDKKKILNNIINNYSPRSIEVGSVVSPKVLPQMENSLDLFKYAKSLDNGIDYYLLVPNKKYLDIAIDSGVQHFSLITSVSEEFQKKNTNKSLNDTKKELDLMINHIDTQLDNYKIKLYLSCINQCPISGIIENNLIVNEIEYYMGYNFDELCLSDTCGTLTYNNFREIIENLKVIDYNKISLHLHYSEQGNMMRILDFCLKKGIIKYDVSFLENSGGCSVTMKSDKINSNLHYDQINNFINEITYFNSDKYICGHKH